jgi:hypothetical protein
MIRRAAAAILGLASGLFAFAAALAVIHSTAAAVVIALVAATVVAWATETGRLFTFDEGACPKSLRMVSAVVSVLGLILLTRLTIFMADPSKVSCSINPYSKWEIGHSCLSAYHVADEAIGIENVYESTLYSVPDSGTGPRTPRTLGPFNVDVFEYPPQFLLLPRAFHLLTPDFLDLRLLWFAFSGGVLLTGLIVVSAHIGGAIGTRALLLSPLLWIALPSTLSTLQKGNVQIVIIATALIGMVLFANGRRAAGGALLAFTIVSKLWPGMLIVYLLARRDWRAVLWTTGFSLLWSGIALAMFGWGAYATFLDHAPGLLSGEAFPAFRNNAAMAINLSIPNILFKLKLFGFPGATFGVAKVLGWIYTVIAIAVTAWAARRPWRSHEQPLVWLAIVIIATLRSPFLPFTYGVIPGLWLLTLVAAIRIPTARSLTLTGLGFIALNANWPQDWPIDPRFLALASLVPLLVMIGLTIRGLRPATFPG